MSSLGRSSHEFLKQCREDRLASYRSSPQDIRAHYSDEGQIQADYHKRFAFELIQNADDAMQEVTGERTVRFELNDGVLLVANTGRPIDEDDVKALCTMSYTTKGTVGEKRASIGHKGRGFSSVLEITDRPQIFSTDISFEFDEKRSRSAITDLVADLDELSMDSIDGVPLMRLPFVPQETPDRVGELLEAGYNTVFRFELKNDQVQQDVIDTIEQLDRNTVVFLQELNRLEIQLDEGRESVWKISCEEKSIDSQATDLEFVTVGFESAGETEERDTFALFSRDDVEIGDHTGGIDENTWGDVEYTQIGLALLVDEVDGDVHLRRLDDHPSVHVFLPTEVQSPIPALINGAFHTAISRTTINVTADSDNYNGYLLEEVSDLLATDVRSYAEETATNVEEFIDCLDFTHLPHDQRDAQDSLEGRFVEALRTTLANVSFVPRLEKLKTGERLAEPGTKPISDIVLPYYSGDNEAIAEATARIYGNEELDIDRVDESGWFPKTTLLKARRAAILEGLGATELDPEDIPLVLGAVPDERSPLIWPDADDELAVDPILQVLVWIWKAIGGQEERVEQFKVAANEAAVFPVGTPDDGVVKHVARDDRTQFFIPPERPTPDIELTGIRFLTRPVYRPESRVEPARQSELVEDIRPALDAIWDVNEFDFEEVVQAAIFPKLPSPRSRYPDEDDSELRDKQVLELIHRLAKQSINATDPLPFIERDGTLHRLCLLPVPTKDGDWAPAYRVYLGTEWQPEEPDERRIEPLLEAADVEAPYLAAPDDLPGEIEYTGEDDEDSEFVEWRRFFKWLGVAQHVRLTPFFDPTEERNFTATLGIDRPEDSSILSRLSATDWEDYQRHLRGELEKTSMKRGEYDSIYKLQGIEYFNEFLEQANEDEDVAIRLFHHLTSWWQDQLREYRRPVLATHDVRSFGRRNQSCPKEREKRRVGLNLWLWQLKRATWCPGNRGREKPEDLWMPTDSVTKRFNVHGTTLLPVLSSDVLETATEARDLLHDLDVRSEPTQGSFDPKDAAIVTTNIAEMFEGEDDEVVADSLRQIKPVYRYVSELLPAMDSPGTIGDEEWRDALDRLRRIKVLCRQGDHNFAFVRAENAAFVRSPDVLDRIPITGVPLFILQEDEAARFGTYFGIRDLEKEADPDPEYIGEREEKTEDVRASLEELAPFVLCRLEAERPSQELIDQDTNGMREFLENLALVEDIMVSYQFSDDETNIEANPEYFLDARGRGRNQRPLPFIRDTRDQTELNRFIARALCEYLGVSQFEGIITLLNAESDERRIQYLKLAGAPSTASEIDGKERALWDETASDLGEREFGLEGDDDEAEGYQIEEKEAPFERRAVRRRNEERRTHPLYDSSDLSLDGDTITIRTEQDEMEGSDGDESATGTGSGDSATVSAKYRTQVDRLGMWVTIQHEHNRLQEAYDCDNPDEYVFDIHDENKYEEVKASEVGGPVVEQLEEHGLPEVFPGFDILVVNPETGEPDRLIELKSSGHDMRTPGVTWNEWKTARDPAVQDLFYLYVVCNLRQDIQADPYLKAIPNPFQLLNAETREQRDITKEVKVDVTSFRQEAEIMKTKLQVDE